MRWVVLCSGVMLGLVFLLGFTGDRSSAAGPRFPLGSPEAAEAQAFDPFDPEEAMLPEDPAPVDDLELWEIFYPGGKPSLHTPPPRIPPSANFLVFIPPRPPAASPIR